MKRRAEAGFPLASLLRNDRVSGICASLKQTIEEEKILISITQLTRKSSYGIITRELKNHRISEKLKRSS